MAKKALLMILDGWGIGKHGKGDVIFNTPTPYLDLLTATSAHSQLQASGEDVGLPDGQMGNSEVGHLNIGAGRIVYQDLVKINRACKDGSIMENPQVKAAYTYAKENNKKLHLMGLTSDGGVHSSLDHLFKLIEIGKAYGLKNQVFVHCYMDGRDTDPHSGKGFIEQISKVCADNDAAIASIVGRFYAMDRDKRWERVKEGYDLIVNGVGKQSTDMVQAMEESYAEGVTDEFIKPIHNASVNGCIEEGDVVTLYKVIGWYTETNETDHTTTNNWQVKAPFTSVSTDVAGYYTRSAESRKGSISRPYPCPASCRSASKRTVRFFPR